MLCNCYNYYYARTPSVINVTNHGISNNSNNTKEKETLTNHTELVLVFGWHVVHVCCIEEERDYICTCVGKSPGSTVRFPRDLEVDREAGLFYDGRGDWR